MINYISQVIFDGLLDGQNMGMAKRAKLSLMRMMRQILIKNGDPLVRYNLEGNNILLPLSHDLAFHRKIYPQYSNNIARITKYVLQKYPNLSLIDIGANVGDTAAIVRSTTNIPILCIEGEERYFDILQKNVVQFNDVFCEKSFVSHFTGTIKGKLQRYEGSSVLLEDSTLSNTVEAKTLTDILAGQPLFQNSKMIKIDTDGFDCLILRSSMNLLGLLRPMIFFEYDPYHFSRYDASGFETFAALKDIGYKKLAVFENNGDYLLTAEIDNRSLLEDIHYFYSGRQGGRYADICVFHEEDDDLSQAVRSAEIEFFLKLRCGSCTWL